MIKGKWRIDLGGKIKGAKSVALGSAVTKRGQDNSLQMCERCKYQAGVGGGSLVGQGSGDRGLDRPWGGLETPGPLHSGAGFSLSGMRVVGWDVWEPLVSNGGFISRAQLPRPRGE